MPVKEERSVISLTKERFYDCFEYTLWCSSAALLPSHFEIILPLTNRVARRKDFGKVCDLLIVHDGYETSIVYSASWLLQKHTRQTDTYSPPSWINFVQKRRIVHTTVSASRQNTSTAPSVVQLVYRVSDLHSFLSTVNEPE